MYRVQKYFNWDRNKYNKKYRIKNNNYKTDRYKIYILIGEKNMCIAKIVFN